jgi:hypothetical protein
VDRYVNRAMRTITVVILVSFLDNPRGRDGTTLTLSAAMFIPSDLKIIKQHLKTESICSDATFPQYINA